MHVHFRENLYKKKIAMWVLFLHPFIHSFTHPVLLGSLLSRHHCRCWAYSTKQTRACPYRIYPCWGRCAYKTQTATLHIIHYMGRSGMETGDWSLERRRESIISESESTYYSIVDGQGGLHKEEIFGRRAEGNKGTVVAAKWLRDEAYVWPRNSKCKTP